MPLKRIRRDNIGYGIKVSFFQQHSSLAAVTVIRSFPCLSFIYIKLNIASCRLRARCIQSIEKCVFINLVVSKSLIFNNRK